MSKTKLKPCFRCGRDSVEPEYQSPYWGIHCGFCGIGIFGFITEQDAIDDWNEPYSLELYEAAVEVLDKKCDICHMRRTRLEDCPGCPFNTLIAAVEKAKGESQ